MVQEKVTGPARALGHFPRTCGPVACVCNHVSFQNLWRSTGASCQFFGVPGNLDPGHQTAIQSPVHLNQAEQLILAMESFDGRRSNPSSASLFGGSMLWP